MNKNHGLPKSWTSCRLGDVVDYGATDKAEPDEIPTDAWVLELEDLERDSSKILHRATFGDRLSKSTKNRFKRGDVLYGKLRPYLNKVVRADADGFCTTEIIPLRATASVSADYLFWWLKHPTFLEYVTATSHGLNMPRLGTEAGKAAPFVLAPLNEQRRIVAKLEALQTRSRRAREALDAVPPLLEKLRQSILAAAFRGDLTKDWRAKQNDPDPGTELLKRVRTTRRQKWEALELGKLISKGNPPTDDKWKTKYKDPERAETTGQAQLPAGWAWATVELVGDVLLGRRRSAEEYVVGLEGRVLRPYVRVANVKEDRLVLDDVLEMPFNEKELALYTLIPGDIVLSEGQSPELVGQSAVYNGGFDDLCIQATVHRFRALECATTSAFAQLVFLNHLHSGYFRAAASLTTNIAHLTSERLKRLRFPLPPLAEQSLIVERARRQLDTLRSLELRLRHLRAAERNLGSAILSKAFRGELGPQDPTDEPAEVMLAHARSAITSIPSGRNAEKRG